MYVLLWCGISIGVAVLYVLSLRGTEKLESATLRRPMMRSVALFAWARMMMVIALFFAMILCLSTVHFILITVVFIATIWLLLWQLTKV